MQVLPSQKYMQTIYFIHIYVRTLFLTIIFLMYKTGFDFDVYDLCENYVTYSFKQLPQFTCINYLNVKDLFPDNNSKVAK